jgi:hypothetical protein
MERASSSAFSSHLFLDVIASHPELAVSHSHSASSRADAFAARTVSKDGVAISGLKSYMRLPRPLLPLCGFGGSQ